MQVQGKCSKNNTNDSLKPHAAQGTIIPWIHQVFILVEDDAINAPTIGIKFAIPAFD